MLNYYYVYVKDMPTEQFCTVHVSSKLLLDALNYATNKTFGGYAFGVKDFGRIAPENFNHGYIENGMKGY